MMQFTIEHLEFYLIIIVRISAFMVSAPFFNITNVPRKVKAGLAVFFALLMISMLPYTPLLYTGVIGYAVLVLKEAVVGACIGLSANICTYIVAFAGQLIDMEIGLSMVSVFDPISRMQTTITGNLYSYLLMLTLIATNMHYYILSAVFDSFELIPIGRVVINPYMYKMWLQFIVDFFIIAFRIILPIFAATLLLNVVLGIMAKVAPQMNMLIIGIQLKIIVGLIILILIVDLTPQVMDFIFTEMKAMIQMAMNAFSGG